MAKPTNEERIKSLENSLNNALVEIEAMKASVAQKPAEKPIEKPEIVPDATQYPVPQSYRDLVRDTFNGSFGCQVTPLADSPQFQFTVIVPEKYSPLTEEQKKMLGGDFRSRVISYAEGVNGVKVWCDKVLSNFNPDAKALIFADKHA